MGDSFEDMFLRATGVRPYPFQSRIAAAGLPDVARLPMGSGKTAGIVLPWLWRRHFATGQVPAETPRRLVFALPMRTLVDQTETNVRRWLANLGVDQEIGVHVVMGGRRTGEHQWRQEAHRPSVVIGTIDCLVSKALMRGYGIARGVYPMDFALVTNGAHIVIDEIQLAPASTATLRQVLGFARRYGTAEPIGLTCMSATVDRRVLDTVDNPADGLSIEEIRDDDRNGRLGVTLTATKTVRRLDVDPDDFAGLASAAVDRHRPGTRTLVVVNTVKTAIGVRKALAKQKPDAPVILIHSRFRPVDRARLADDLVAAPPEAGSIVVATQVVEAGVDIDSAVMITEASPWPSLCQRTGRCNRYAAVADAEVWWFVAGRGPYDPEETAETERVLSRLEGQACTGEQLLAQDVPPGDLALRILRRPEFLSLFDTAPDLTGADIDIAPYIRDGDQLDAQVAWIEAETRGALDATIAMPDQAWRCAAPVGEVRKLTERAGVRSWAFDVVTERWERIRPKATRIRPGEILLVHAEDGGYDANFGFDPASKRTVALPPPIESKPAGDLSDAMTDESSNIDVDQWLGLDQHLRESAQQAAALLGAMAPDLSDELCRVVVGAALLHDVGKSHPVWQSAISGSSSNGERPEGLIAKSPGKGRLNFGERRGLRHELVSALMLGEPVAAELRAYAEVAGTGRLPLLQYLVAAHHGKVRVQVADPRGSLVVDDQLLGLEPDEPLPAETILGQQVAEWRVNLDSFALGGDGSWTASVLRLLDELGPFRLAYLETMVRVADWRASANLPLPEEANHR